MEKIKEWLLSSFEQAPHAVVIGAVFLVCFYLFYITLAEYGWS
ncbi:MAG: hypothetical protein WBB23_13645 [Desulforhopalus sp.]